MNEDNKETNISTQVISLIEDKIKNISGVKNKRHAVGRHIAEIISDLVILCDEYGIRCLEFGGNWEFDEETNELYN